MWGHCFGRCSIFPKFINKETGDFDPEQLFELMEIKPLDPETGKRVKTGVYALSLASEYLSDGEAGVHKYGQWAADHQNKCFLERNGQPPDPASLYLGYYKFEGADIYSFPASYHDVYIRWLPEHDNHCHFQIEAKIRDDQGNGKAERTQRMNERIKISRHVIASLVSYLPVPSEMYVADENEYRGVLPEVNKLKENLGRA